MSFLKTFQESFESGQLGVTVEEITDNEAQSIRDGQLVTASTLMVSGDKMDVSHVEPLGDMIVNVREAVQELKKTSVALTPSIVPVTNDQIKDLANYLKLDAPNPITYDLNTQVVDEVSLESAMGWMSKLWEHFKATLDKLSFRVKTTLTRFKVSSDSINTRIYRIQAVQGRRKNPKGGNPIELSKDYLESLVHGRDLSKDPVKGLSEVGSVLNGIFVTTGKLLTTTYEELTENLKSGTKSDKTYFTKREAYRSALNRQLQDLVKVKTPFMGNMLFTVIKNRGSRQNSIPYGRWAPTVPSASHVVESLDTIPSLSNSQIRSMVSGVIKENKMVMSGLDNLWGALDIDVSWLKEDVSKLQGLVDEKDLNQLEIEVKRFVSDYYEVLDYMVESYLYYFSIADAILAYVEESILGD